ncbi:hypothetical protein F8B43_4746 [Methylorubrum populi]|uniref:Uncharacterized protein n=1 Tax=Methylorubrum populi TaxID=223967 RepID=A0A833MW88_9HYPH|nr:hypothetical protein F8B43_4746 [Methylorubrum populi]
MRLVIPDPCVGRFQGAWIRLRNRCAAGEKQNLVQFQKNFEWRLSG